MGSLHRRKQPGKPRLRERVYIARYCIVCDKETRWEGSPHLMGTDFTCLGCYSRSFTPSKGKGGAR